MKIDPPTELYPLRKNCRSFFHDICITTCLFTFRLTKHAIISPKFVLFNRGWKLTCKYFPKNNSAIDMDHCISDLRILKIVFLAPKTSRVRKKRNPVGMQVIHNAVFFT